MKKSILIVSALSMLFFTNCKTSSDSEKRVEDLAVESTEDGKVLLRVKPKKGTKTNMLFTTVMDSEIVKMDMAMNMNIEITENTDSDYTYLLDVENIKMEGGAGEMTMTYDSEKVATDEISKQMAEQFKPLLEENISMVVNEFGAVQSVDSKSTSGMPNADLDFGALSIELPKEEVGVGDSWTSNKDLNGTKVNFTMTVTKITSSSVMVDVKGDLKLGEEAAGESIETKGITGNYEIDRETGLTKFGEMKAEMGIGNQPMKISTTFKQI